MRFPTLAYSYDQDLWSLWVCIGGERAYLYKNVSPFHHDKFLRLVRRNRGKAMVFLKDFACVKCTWTELGKKEVLR